MRTMAVINSGVVIDTVLWDGVQTWSPGSGNTSIDVTGMTVSIGYTYNGSTFTAPTPLPIEAMQPSSSAVDGYLKATDWSKFNAKLGAMTFTQSTPTRSLNNVFTPSLTNAVMCFYSISISCTMSLTSGQTGSVTLYCDTNATPSTFGSQVSNTNSGSLTIGLNLVNSQTEVLMYLVPPGYNVRLVSSGSASISIVGQAEIAIAAS